MRENAAARQVKAPQKGHPPRSLAPMQEQAGTKCPGLSSTWMVWLPALNSTGGVCVRIVYGVTLTMLTDSIRIPP